jgi:hypothetical protein
VNDEWFSEDDTPKYKPTLWAIRLELLKRAMTIIPARHKCADGI